MSEEKCVLPCYARCNILFSSRQWREIRLYIIVDQLMGCNVWGILDRNEMKFISFLLISIDLVLEDFKFFFSFAASYLLQDFRIHIESNRLLLSLCPTIRVETYLVGHFVQINKKV